MAERTLVELPPSVRGPFEVYVNGVPQRRGRDYEQLGRTLVFERELKQEGPLGFWRWLSICAGVAGTYRQDDSVDVVYVADGRRVVAPRLAISAAAGPDGVGPAGRADRPTATGS